MHDHAAVLRQANYDRWFSFVEQIAETLQWGRSIGNEDYHAIVSPKALDHGEDPPRFTVLLCSPHPDDEALVGALAVRARSELGARVINCAVTLGSNTVRRQERLTELHRSCAVLGFELAVLGAPDSLGLDNVNLESLHNDPSGWRGKVALLRTLIEKIEPDIILCPHPEDLNTTHEGTSRLVREAAIAYSAECATRVLLAETEYWYPMRRPNLMVGVSAADEALLVVAVAQHKGEMGRNPYHLSHPARMIDNVRRGSETLLGQGKPARDFTFAELYRVSCLREGSERATTSG